MYNTMIAGRKIAIPNEEIHPLGGLGKKMPGRRTCMMGIFVLVLSVLTFRISRAEVLPGGGDYSFDASIGYNHANVSGNRTKLGEYEYLHSSLEGTFALQGNGRGYYLDLWGDFQNEYDQQYMLAFDSSRIFQTETSYSRFIHYLDNDPLTNQDFFSNFNTGETNSIVVENITSENTLRIPLVPALKINADYRELNRRGHRQATTVTHCTECHVTSKNKYISQSTKDINLGAEMKIKFFTFNYHHTQRDFDEGANAPLAFYTYPTESFKQYSGVPDSKTTIDTFRANAALPLQSSVTFNYQSGENRNRDTHNERDYESFAFRLVTAGLKYVTLNFNYFDYDSDKDAVNAMDKDVSRSTVSFTTRPWKKNFFRGSYRWEDIDRTNTDEASTSRQILNLAFFSRPRRTVDFNIRYTNEQNSDPFANQEDWGLFRSMQSSMPTRSDALTLAFNWNPRGNLSLSSTLRYEEADSGRYDIDEEQMEWMVSLWFAPRNDLIITGYYSLIDTEIDTLTSYKTYHGWWLSDFSFDNSTPYDAKTNCFNLIVNYRLKQNVALTGNVTYTDSDSDFDADVYGANVGDYSKLKIERIDAQFGIDYFYTPQLSFYAQYNYRDYNDGEDSILDGELNYVSIGVHYTF